MTPLYGHDELVAGFVCKLIKGMDRGFDNYKAIGFLDNQNRLVAGMVYHNWHPEAGVIEMSGAATTPKWLTKPVLNLIFDYPFRVCGCQMAVMNVSEHNKRLHRQLHAAGFKSHTIPRLRGRDEDGILFTLTDTDWYAGKFANGQT